MCHKHRYHRETDHYHHCYWIRWWSKNSLIFWKRTDANKEGLTRNWERVWLSGFKWELRHGTICNLSSFALGSPSPPSVCQSRLSSAGEGHNPLTGSRLGEERYWADFLESLQVHNKELHETRLAQYKWQAHFRGHCDESVWHLRGTKAPKPFQMLIWNSSEVGGYSDPPGDWNKCHCKRLSLYPVSL